MRKYPLSTQQLTDPELQVDVARVHLKPPHQVIPMHDHTYTEFTLVAKGKGVHIHQTGEHILEPGNLLLVRSHHIHGFKTSSSLELLNIAIAQEPFLELLSRYDLPQFSSYQDDTGISPICFRMTTNKMLGFEQLAHKVLTVDHAGSFQITKVMYDLIEFIVEDSITVSVPDTIPDWLKHTCSEMHRSDYLKQGLQKLFDISCKCPEHVSRSFKKYLGLSPTEYMKSLRLEESRKLLSITDLPMNEISDACGFSSQSYFIRTFKANYGITPLQFRKKKMGIVTDRIY